MKNRWKHIFIPVPAMVICLNLAACSDSSDVAGNDWRTTGVVVGSGTITHNGESVDVLVTVSESSAAFYRDLPEQVLFDSVSFPMNIPDAAQAFNAISFEDIDGDGESDVLVSFIHENGDATELSWIWDPAEGFQPQQHFARSCHHGYRHRRPLQQPIFQPLLLMRRDSYEKETQ